jgi:23S rRNA pseudouridine1911/1915/1917 synthase
MRCDLEYVVSAADGDMTARGVLRSRLGVSRRLMRTIANARESGDSAFCGGVFVNGQPALFSDRVEVGDVVGLSYPDEASGFIPQNIPIDVLYEDEDVIALNKQPGVVVHPTKGHSDGTIANGLMKRMADRGERYKIRFANRLDRDTSGVLLVAKNPHAQNWFTRQSEAGRIRKLYLAVLDGEPEAESGVIEAPIALEREGEPRRAVREDGAVSRTFYRVIESYSYRTAGGEKGEPEATRAALALISITTGRTHQIRVHMAHIGVPVMGDVLYGRAAPTLSRDRDEADRVAPTGRDGEPAPLIGRQALHAALLRFVHPRTREEMTICAPLPPDMAALLR